MVRANELGCRNGWNADLWVPADTDESTSQRMQPHDSISGRAKAEVGPAAQTDLITSIVAAKTDNATLPPDRPSLTAPVPSSSHAVEEDIFVKQTPSLSWSTGPISTQPATELVQDPKAAILRARDQFRARRKTEGRLADRQLVPPPAPMLASSREASMVDELDLVDPEPALDSVDPRYENRPLLRPAPVDSYAGNRPVAPVTRREIERPFPSMTEFPEDRVRFESVPHTPQDSEELLVAQDDQDDMWLETRQIDSVPPEPYVVDDLFEEDELSVEIANDSFPAEELTVRHRESPLNRFLRQRRERRDRPAYIEESQPAHAIFEEPLFEESPPLAAESVASIPARPPEVRFPDMRRPDPESRQTNHVIRPERDEPAPQAVRSATRQRDERPDRPMAAAPESGSRRPVQPPAGFDDDFVLPPPLPALEPGNQHEPSRMGRPRPRFEQTAPVRQPAMQRERIEQPAVDEFGDKPLFATNPLPPVEDYEIDSPAGVHSAPALPNFRLERICQTCRDFRPSDNGERGWCNNKWAFNHRRMVDADDLACRNSLGSWWTPKDDVWRRDGDISRHAQQTPRVDQWLFGSATDENERRRSGS